MSYRVEDDPVVIEGVTIKKETDKAILCVIEGEEMWIPKSQVDDNSEVYQEGDEGALMISHWIATQKGLV